ncbi:MAG: DUF2330 domain-containing protein [Deltaproteobacteria bacterium]|nr:DUF2330 domain-containing protein [Deltaproteobacteria bacterium]
MSRRSLTLALPLACAAALFAADRADACGGLFCDSASPTPVDQQAERVLFEVNEDQSVTATVEVRYNGDPSAFSWIIPVSEAPDFVDVGNAAVFQLLDAATRPSILPPQGDFSNCPSSPFGFGCGLAFSPAVGEGEGEGDVTVTEYPNVGPYSDIIVVEGTDTNVVMSYLNDNGYLVTEAMRPVFEEYTAESQRYLAVRLQPDATVKDIVPVRFHCPAPGPVIPLRLTQVAALPEMGILVFIAGAQRYRPANYSELLIPAEDLRTDGFGQTNYFPLVSKRIDELGGFGFVTERAQPSATVRGLVGNVFLGTPEEDAGRAEVERLLTDRPYLTRMYTRMSGHEMIVDPVFTESDGGDVDGTLDLSDQTIDACGGGPVAPPCGLLYCGDVDSCASTDQGDGCRCFSSRTARASVAPNGQPTVSCVPSDYDFIGGAGMRGCDGVDCGEGTCLPQNGTATCRCTPEAAAIVDTSSPAGVRCVAAGESYASDQLLWPEPVAPGTTACSGGRGDRAGGALSLVLLLTSSLALRLHRRR